MPIKLIKKTSALALMSALLAPLASGADKSYSPCAGRDYPARLL